MEMATLFPRSWGSKEEERVEILFLFSDVFRFDVLPLLRNRVEYGIEPRT